MWLLGHTPTAPAFLASSGTAAACARCRCSRHANTASSLPKVEGEAGCPCVLESIATSAPHPPVCLATSSCKPRNILLHACNVITAVLCLLECHLSDCKRYRSAVLVFWAFMKHRWGVTHGARTKKSSVWQLPLLSSSMRGPYRRARRPWPASRRSHRP